MLSQLHVMCSVGREADYELWINPSAICWHYWELTIFSTLAG